MVESGVVGLRCKITDLGQAQCVKEVMEGGALSNSQYLPVSSVFLHGMGSNNPCSKRATPTNSLKCI